MQGNTGPGAGRCKHVVRDDRRMVKGLAVWQLHGFVFSHCVVSDIGILALWKQATTNTSSSLCAGEDGL